MENDSSETLEGTAFENKFQATFFFQLLYFILFSKKKKIIYTFLLFSN